MKNGLNPRTLALLCWLPALVVVGAAITLAMLWNELPARMAIHFAANGTPNGWSTREGFAWAMMPVVPVLALLGYLSYRIGVRRRLPGAFMLMTHLSVAAVVAYGFVDTIRYNLTQRPIGVSLAAILAMLIPIAIAALAIGIDWRWWWSQRQVTVPAGRLVATETHGARAWTWVFGAVAVVMLVAAYVAAPSAKFGLLLGSLAVIASAVWAWKGFEYRFTTSYVEVRMLWLRLRRIPLRDITGYKAEDCSPLFDFGGWGIKGFGNETAYIWGGHHALKLETPRGTVYLGHKHPEQLARDLDLAKSS